MAKKPKQANERAKDKKKEKKKSGLNGKKPKQANERSKDRKKEEKNGLDSEYNWLGQRTGADP